MAREANVTHTGVGDNLDRLNTNTGRSGQQDDMVPGLNLHVDDAIHLGFAALTIAIIIFFITLCCCKWLRHKRRARKQEETEKQQRLLHCHALIGGDGVTSSRISVETARRLHGLKDPLCRTTLLPDSKYQSLSNDATTPRMQNQSTNHCTDSNTDAMTHNSCHGYPTAGSPVSLYRQKPVTAPPCHTVVLDMTEEDSSSSKTSLKLSSGDSKPEVSISRASLGENDFLVVSTPVCSSSAYPKNASDIENKRGERAFSPHLPVDIEKTRGECACGPHLADDIEKTRGECAGEWPGEDCQSQFPHTSLVAKQEAGRLIGETSSVQNITNGYSQLQGPGPSSPSE